MRKLLFLIAIAVMFASASLAQNIDYLGSTLWSGVCDVKIQGNYAYCAFFNGLVILDITNPSSPQFVSQLYTGGEWYGYDEWEGQRLFLSGDYIYFAADEFGLKIINISDPANPILAASYATPSYAVDVFVRDSLAYVTCKASSLEILNVADPASPILAGRCPITSNARCLFIQGNYAYVADD